MKILITGGAGFIGKCLVDKLPEKAELILVDSLDPQVHRSSRDFAPHLQERAKCIQADVQNIELHKDVLEGIDVAIHLASQTGTGQSMYQISRYVQQNANGTAKLLELISQLEHKPRRIILSSSRAVYGDGAYTDGRATYYPKGRRLEDLQNGLWEICNDRGEPITALPMHESHLTKPTSVYGLTKLWQEQLLQNYCQSQKIELVTLRFQNVYGPRQELGNPYTGIIGIFTNAIVQGNTLEIFEDGQMTRDFVFVEDVVEVVIKCVMQEQPLAATMNIGTGKGVTLLELVETIAELVERRVNYRISGRFRVGDIRHAVADMSHYKSLLGEWSPTSLKAGLTQYLEWYLEQEPLCQTTLQQSFKEMEKTGLLLSKHA